MTIDFKNDHGKPQFVVKAESQYDHDILNMFVDYGYKHKEKFWMHGSCYESGKGTTSFNFGYIKPSKKNLFQRLKDAFLNK